MSGRSRGSTDTDFTAARLVARANRELANGLGNLVNRTVTLTHRYPLEPLPAVNRNSVSALTAAAALPDRIDNALARFDFRAATDAIWEVVLTGNRTLEHERPWELGRHPTDPTIRARLNTVLAALVDACRTLAEECTPFIPDGAAQLLRQLGTGTRPGPVGPTFALLNTSTPDPITIAS